MIELFMVLVIFGWLWLLVNRNHPPVPNTGTKKRKIRRRNSHGAMRRRRHAANSRKSTRPNRACFECGTTKTTKGALFGVIPIRFCQKCGVWWTR